jgi:hypothetical protein
MTSLQFIQAITQVGRPVLIQNETITQQVNLLSNIVAIGVILENCTFEQGVYFENINLNCGIKFKGCEFKKNLSINECKASNYNLEFNFTGNHLEFSNTKINGLYFNRNNEIERGIRICDKSEIVKIQVRTLMSNIGGFEIDDSTISNVFDISQAKFSNNISIRNNSIIDAKIRFENLTCGSFVFTGSNFKKDIHIWAGNSGSLIFNDGVFDEDIFIIAVPISSCLTIIGTEFKKALNFNLRDDTNNKNGIITEVYIQSGKFGENLNINGNNFQIDNVTIDTSKQLEGDLFFNSCQILKTEISGSNYKSNIVFNHTFINHLYFNFFNNYSTVSFISLKSYLTKSQLTINHSNLGKTHFFNAFLNSFDKVEIYNSILTEIIIANVKWFKDTNLNPNQLENSIEYTYKKEIYRQIKYALEKQGDRITSLHFKALEMKAFKRESFAQVKWYKKILNTDRFILWVGQTNSFGQNWFKPVLFAIFFTLLFFVLITIGVSDKLSYLPNYSCDSISLTFNELYNYSNIIPQLMNPTNSLNKILPENIKLSFIVNLWDYLLKITLAFFIFQIISAFRKYMK